MNHRLTITLCLLVSALGAPYASGAEAEAAPAAEDRSSQADTETTTPSADDDAAGTRPEGTGDVFLPSEEISEDFAVSFPVDI